MASFHCGLLRASLTFFCFPSITLVLQSLDLTMPSLALMTIEWILVVEIGGAMGNSTPRSIPIGSKIVIGWVWTRGNA